VPCSRKQQVNLPACSPQYLFNVERPNTETMNIAFYSYWFD